MLIIFYDGDCAMCNGVVRWILAKDKKGQFYFAPLQGTTAQRALKVKELSLNTMVLLENGECYTEGEAALRIFWLLGGKWKLIGWTCFLPSFLFNRLYRIVAKNRYRFDFNRQSLDPEGSKDRFLP